MAIVMRGKRAADAATSILDLFQNVSEDLPRMLAPVFINRHQDIPCRKWSFGNRLLTAMGRTDDARGCRQWNKVGRKVMKGEHARIFILMPCTSKIGEDKDTGDPVYRTVGFFGKAVFAYDQTEGDPLEYREKDAEHIDALPLIEVARKWGIDVKCFDAHIGEFLGTFSRMSTSISLGVEDVNTWAHELIHASDNRLGSLIEEPQHWRSETVAALGSAVLLQCLGYDDTESDIGGVYKYIELYAKAAGKKTVSACLEVLDRVGKCVEQILDASEEFATVRELEA